VRSSAAAGNMVILSNIIRYNSYHGLYLYDGADAFLGHNTITNNSSNNTQAGVFCITNSDPFIRQTDGINYGYNIIQNNVGIGVHAASNSYPSLGINELNKTKYGYNDIHDNNGYEVDNGNASGTIMAERNYWSADHTNPTAPSDVYGSVSYAPALPEAPSETAGKLSPSQKSSIDFSEAFALEIQDEFQTAADLYLQLLEGDPDADNVGFGVSGLIRCYKALDRRQEIPQLLEQLINSFPQKTLATSAKDHELPYLV
jgi:parallel beta-helix repeat protein